MKLPLVDRQKMVKILKHNGFKPIRQRGSHIQLQDSKSRIVTIPLHGVRLIGRGLLRKILRDSEKSREEYIKLRKIS